MLEPATAEMPPAFARKILQLRAEGDVLLRIEQLRSKANEGTLSEAEDLEYKEIVEAIDIVALFQQQARKALSVTQNVD
jgi:hypothetical protein